MKRLLFPLSILVVVVMLWASVRPARACQCVSHSAAEYVDRADIVLVGKLLLFRPGNHTKDEPIFDTATMKVERYLKGSGPSEVIVADDFPCLPGLVQTAIGQRHIVFIDFVRGPETNACLGTGALDNPFVNSSAPYPFAPAALLSDVLGQVGVGTPPDDSLSEMRPPEAADFPRLPAAIAATLGPLAFLAGAAFVWRGAADRRLTK